MSTAKKILGNTAVQVAGRAAMALISIAILKIITGFLGVEGYGMYSGVYEFLAFFGIAADLGLFTICVREMSKGEEDRNFIVGNIFGMRIGLAALMMMLATVSIFFIPRYSGTPIPLGVAISSLAVFLAILQGTVSSVLQVELKMQYATIGLVLGKVVNLAWMAGVVFLFYKGNPGDPAFYQLLWAGVFGNLASFLFTYHYARKFAHVKPQMNKAYWKKIFTTAVPYGLALVMNMVYFRIDGIMILFMKGPKELGFYSPSVRMLEILSVMAVYFMNSVLPVLTRKMKEGMAEAQRVAQMAFDFLYMVGLPMAVGLYLLSYSIIAMTTQPEFLSNIPAGIYGADAALRILAFAMFFSYLNSLFTYSLLAVNKQNHLLWINGSAAIFNILANFLAIPGYGFRGAAFTSVLTEIFILGASYWIVRKHLNYHFNWGRLAKATVAATAMAGVLVVLKEPVLAFAGLGSLNAIWLVGIGGLVYLFGLWLLGAIPEEFQGQLARFKLRRP